MDDSVKKVPGCDKFTRPEEINALSKYLKQKRIDLEEETTLQKDTLGIPGYTDPAGSLKDDFEKLPESIDPNSQTVPGGVESDRIKELNDIREKLSGDPKNNISLDNSRSDIQKPEDPGLNNSRLDLQKQEDPVLNDSVLGLRKPEENPRLDNSRLDLRKPKDPKLDNKIEKLKKHSEPKLDNSIEKIEPKSDPKLTDTVEKIKDNSTDNLKLRNEKISLENAKPEKINLETTSERLEVDNGRLDLDNTVSNITGQKEVEDLGSSVLDLSGEQKEPGLSDTVVNLKDTSEGSNKLDDSKFNLPGGQKKQDLSDVKKPLPGERKELNLSDYLDTLGIDNSEVSLNKDVSELYTDGNNIQLDSKVAELKPEKEKISLGEGIEKLKLNEKELSLVKSSETLVLPKSDPSLIQTSEKLEIPETEIGLTQKRESVPGERKDIENFSNSVVDITGDTDKVEFLDDQKETITDVRKDIKLDESRSDISINSDSSLDTTRKDLSGTQKPVKLNDSRSDIKVKIDSSLDDSISRITEVKDVDLDDTVDTLKTDQDNKLDDSIDSRPGEDKEVNLQDGAVGIIDNGQDLSNDDGREVVELDGTIKSRPKYDPHPDTASPLIDNNTGEISEDFLEEVDKILKSRKDLNLYYTNILHFADSKELDKGWASKVKSLMSAYLSSDTKNIDYDKALNFENALYGSIINVSDFSDTDTELPVNTNSDLDSTIETTIEGNNSFGKNDTWIPRYKLNRLNKFDSSTPLRTLNSIDTDIKSLIGAPEKYIRWAAETALGIDKNHKLDRESLLDETLKVLVKYRRELEIVSKLSRDRLPGNDVNNLISAATSGSIKNVISTLGKNLKSGFDEWKSGKRLGVDTSQIHNRPNLDKTEGKVKTTSFDRANRRPDALDTYDPDKHDTTAQKGTIKNLLKKNTITGLLKSAVTGHFLDSDSDANSYNFFSNYIGPYLGIGTTLEELAGTNVENLRDQSVEELQDVLKNSDYITSYNKYTSGPDGYKTTTLDSNNYWELIFEPFVGIENGGYSYLPRIEEINAWNLINFGVSTGYSRWIPFISFELQKSRLNSKTVGLYQGEISYPVSMDFTNEFRVSIVDDQYKSWRTYFERCVDASIYNSEVHNAGYYGYERDKYGLPIDWKGPEITDELYDFLYLTPIDKKFPCVSLYKNVTFRCKIYSLTPQLSTISKYDLLLVLKDFSEERNGDISGGGNELNLSFSIVGENPRKITSPLNDVSGLSSVYESSYNYGYSKEYMETDEYKNWKKAEDEDREAAYEDWQNKEKAATEAKTKWNEAKDVAKKNKDKSKQADLDNKEKSAKTEYDTKRKEADEAKAKYNKLNKSTPTKTNSTSTRTGKGKNKKTGKGKKKTSGSSTKTDKGKKK